MISMTDADLLDHHPFQVGCTAATHMKCHEEQVPRRQDVPARESFCYRPKHFDANVLLAYWACAQGTLHVRIVYTASRLHVFPFPS